MWRNITVQNLFVLIIFISSLSVANGDRNNLRSGNILRSSGGVHDQLEYSAPYFTKARRLTGTEEVWNPTRVATITDSSVTWLGTSLAVSGTYAIVGSNVTKEAYIYFNNAGVWQTTPVAAITAYTAIEGFGTSVAISTNYAVVGAVANKDALSGAAYIFSLSGGAWGTTAISSASSSGGFGYAVAISDLYCAVGAPGAQTVYVFAYDSVTSAWATSAAAQSLSESPVVLGGYVFCTIDLPSFSVCDVAVSVSLSFIHCILWHRMT
jgi:hypothetical protein